ncbi:MBL fold metallo-hydrolase [Bacteroidaceae bacterium HV4-6-C5C]|nr:MBL fold metallo-hydrolase [Bacteroidaceae bacterium HV4-6-C5C]
MTLHYIYHSGFAIETDHVTVIIDYYKDSSSKNPNEGIVHHKLLKKGGEIYVLSSHFHPDHFNRDILSWKAEHPNIHYILSKDILKHRRASKEDGVYINKGEVYEDENIRIEAFGSTDSGISFLINLQGMRLFHAGDLNNWHWDEESTPEEIRKAESDFLAELKYLKQTAPQIDVAMFPVDRRLGKNYMRGAEQFIDAIATGTFVPMHFSEDYEGGNRFKETALKKGCRFISITHRGESFDIY